MMKPISVWKQELAGGTHHRPAGLPLLLLRRSRPLPTPHAMRQCWTGWKLPLVPTPRPDCTAPRAAPRSAATTPTTSMAGCWPAA